MSVAREWARACGGEATSAIAFLCPAPGHSAKDRSLSVKLTPDAPDGFIVFPHAGDDAIACRDHIRACLGLPMFDRRRPRREVARLGERKQGEAPPDNAAAAARMWRQTTALSGTLGEHYLRQVRGIRCTLPPTMRFLPAREDYRAAIVTAFGIPSELEPGVMGVADLAVRAVHRTLLNADGTSIRDEKGKRVKRFLGSPGGLPLMVAPWTEAGRGLVIAEGVEDALSGHEATGLAAWAGGSAGHMGKLAPTVPAWVETVIIFRDDNDAGRSATRILADALVARGVEVAVWGGARG